MALRTLDSALYRDSLRAMGFDARTCDVKDLVTWVSQGIVQAQENPLTNLLGFELWRHHPHVSLTAHFSGVLLLLCPARWYDDLATHDRAILQEAIAEVTSGGVLQVRGAVVENGSRTGKLGDCERKNRELQLHVSSCERTMSYSTIVANTAKSVLYPRCAL